jgi:hypothetical protein
MFKNRLSRTSRTSRKYNQKGGAEFIPHSSNESEEQLNLINPYSVIYISCFSNKNQIFSYLTS